MNAADMTHALFICKRVVCLRVPDDYDYMQPELVALLEERAGRYLGG